MKEKIADELFKEAEMTVEDLYKAGEAQCKYPNQKTIAYKLMRKAFQKQAEEYDKKLADMEQMWKLDAELSKKRAKEIEEYDKKLQDYELRIVVAESAVIEKDKEIEELKKRIDEINKNRAYDLKKYAELDVQLSTIRGEIDDLLFYWRSMQTEGKSEIVDKIVEDLESLKSKGE